MNYKKKHSQLPLRQYFFDVTIQYRQDLENSLYPNNIKNFNTFCCYILGFATVEKFSSYNTEVSPFKI